MDPKTIVLSRSRRNGKQQACGATEVSTRPSSGLSSANFELSRVSATTVANLLTGWPVFALFHLFRKLLRRNLIALYAAGYQGTRTSVPRALTRRGDRGQGCLQAVVR